MFHKHKWVKVKETYAPSGMEQGITKFGGGDASWELMVLLKGLTTILWECSICQKTKQEKMLGKATQP